jgi:GntR family transcriptional regulator
MKAYEVLEEEGIVSAIKGKGFCVNSQDTDMMKEQHLRLVESSLSEAIKAAKVAKISNEELIQTLRDLLDVENY